MLSQCGRVKVAAPRWYRLAKLTSLLVELAQHLADDLAHALQRLQVVLGLVVIRLHYARLVAHCEPRTPGGE